ncbi:aldehyde dehydrogenase family protein [Pseudonocardia cypriaca]|uniref:Succinate-semialdehyde dehydrogenase/glutarate-semialdehyde dehydrogenase n=1 Tax=Pseudonocardia cypriaca TaxID=882449 RepID=A0A543FTC9_9PSEU|nr:aldehyde dehydrogenase family protein [Pseudonocardia cypriaca]TQM37004.1 succinate-semialdehyde dehydrogenase/glutarate-semialdehyde dehydrogenase [Pseudonocardia cypriaca]
MPIAVHNPTTGEVEKEYAAHTPEQIEAALAASTAAFETLRRTSFEERAGWMHRAADILDAEAEQVARTISTEMGKTFASALFEAHKSAKGMRHYADHAATYLASEAPVRPDQVGASRIAVRYEPIGPVLAVMPWNYPIWQAMRFAAPALMAGNTGLLKHASNVPESALYLGELFARGGFPEGAFQTLLVEGGQVLPLLDDRRIRAVTLTGSVGAGAAVAAAAGRNVKKSVLELGGADAFVVLPSADLDAAVPVAVNARVGNSGQSCIAGKRFIVHRDVYDEFEQRFTSAMAATVYGDPFADKTTFGPMATEAVRREVHELVEDARAKGARVLTGGELPDGPGWFYPATVLSGVTPDMRIAREECFGPVACLFPAENAHDALRQANESDFGLSASVWTRFPAEIELFSTGLETGGVFVNGFTSSFPQLPFGGVKDSGYGRELAGVGIREFVNIKTVWQA